MLGDFLIHYFENGFCFLTALKQRVEIIQIVGQCVNLRPMLLVDYIILLILLVQKVTQLS